MDELFNSIKGLRIWQMGLVITVLVGAFGGAYLGVTRVTEADQIPLDDTQQLIPVRLGNLSNEVSILPYERACSPFACSEGRTARMCATANLVGGVSRRGAGR